MSRESRRLARIATEAAIRQEMDTHPVDRGDHWMDANRVREIIEVMRGCDQRPTFDSIARQFKHETGRDLPEVWKRSPPAWLRRRVEEDAGTPLPPVEHTD